MHPYLTMRAAQSARNDPVAQHRLRLDYIKLALDTALRGNATRYDDAVSLSYGRTKEARAFKAGFAAVPRPKKFEINGQPFGGKVTDELSKQIEERAQQLTDSFERAFLEVMPLPLPK